MRWIALLALAGCISPAAEGDYGDPTAVQNQTTANGITARLISPFIAQTQQAPIIKLVFEAFVDDASSLALAVIDAEGSAYTAISSGEPGPDQRFEVYVPLLHGSNPFSVRIDAPNRRRILDLNFIYDGAAPGIRFGISDAGSAACARSVVERVTAAERVCVRGRVTEGLDAVNTIEVRVDDRSAAPAFTQTGVFDVQQPL
ncbi:MAG: hypothetical protein AAFV29_19110, partial [Myxococcota bacterium]